MHAHPDRYRRLRVLTPLLVTALAASTLAGQRLSADESTPVGVSADNLRARPRRGRDGVRQIVELELRGDLIDGGRSSEWNQ